MGEETYNKRREELLKNIEKRKEKHADFKENVKRDVVQKETPEGIVIQETEELGEADQETGILDLEKQQVVRSPKATGEMISTMKPARTTVEFPETKAQDVPAQTDILELTKEQRVVKREASPDVKEELAELGTALGKAGNRAELEELQKKYTALQKKAGEEIAKQIKKERRETQQVQMREATMGDIYPHEKLRGDYTQLIKDVKSWDTLIARLHVIGPVKEGEREFAPEELEHIIANKRGDHDADISALPLWVQKKVGELLTKEPRQAEYGDMYPNVEDVLVLSDKEKLDRPRALQKLSTAERTERKKLEQSIELVTTMSGLIEVVRNFGGTIPAESGGGMSAENAAQLLEKFASDSKTPLEILPRAFGIRDRAQALHFADKERGKTMTEPPAIREELRNIAEREPSKKKIEKPTGWFAKWRAEKKWEKQKKEDLKRLMKRAVKKYANKPSKSGKTYSPRKIKKIVQHVISPERGRGIDLEILNDILSVKEKARGRTLLGEIENFQRIQRADQATQQFLKK